MSDAPPNPLVPRRSFLQTASALGAWAGLSGSGVLPKFPSVTADDARSAPDYVQFRPEIEPLVRLLEDTPRNELLEEVASRIRRGTTYREVLTALQLAGVRNIQPRPVGFKFHAVLVINSAHLASLNSPDQDRWLPIFWALDQFKSSQAQDVKEGDWTMAALDEAAVPAADKARVAFTRAMDQWDEAATDVATAGLARSAGAQEVFDVFCRYGARDFRDLGHKAIYVANSWRTLQNIGWHHAEPVLRSLAYALLEREGTNPAQGDALADRPGRRHEQVLKDIRPDWHSGRVDTNAAQALLTVIREGSWQDTSEKTLQLIQAGVGPTSIWDAALSAASELLMRKPGIATLHAVTTMNALHYAFQQTAQDDTRRFLLLQATAFLPLFRRTAGAGAEKGPEIDTFEPKEMNTEKPEEALESIFADLEGNRLEGARRTLSWLETNGNPRAFIDVAQRYIYLKGTNSHDYKFSSAVLEDFTHLSPRFRNRFLAASVHWLKGSSGRDNPLVARTRAAL
jgi:hypothetical protein